jgi:hypothetical protein
LSDFSRAGSGAKIITKSSTPVNLLEDIQGRTLTSLVITWETPVFIGGSQITGY